MPGNDYTKFLNPSALEGARIGVPRASFYEGVSDAGSLRQLMEEAIAVLRQQGAVVVDPSDLPSVAGAGSAEQFSAVVDLRRHENAKGRIRIARWC